MNRRGIYRRHHFFWTLLVCGLALGHISAEEYVLKKGQVSGYGQVEIEQADPEYGGGFSMYVAVWPLVEQYPGSQYQTGLFHTWMFANYDSSIDTKGMYSCIEGGLGWWRDTSFATETPKFIMGGVALNFSEWANGPGAGKGRSWEEPNGKYAVAQLSSRVLWPPDGLNFEQGTCGDLFGYGYRPLPLLEPKTSTYGNPVPTGNQCWTLFINAENAKGPLTFFLPEFFSRPAIRETKMAGQFLDSRPSNSSRPLSMETQYIPAVIAENDNGEIYAKVDQILFPGEPHGRGATLAHQVTSYKKGALWDSLEEWFQGGDAAPSEFEKRDLVVHSFTGRAGSSWKIFANSMSEGERFGIEWNAFMEPKLLNDHTFAYQWDKRLVEMGRYKNQKVYQFPQYFRLKDKKWHPIPEREVPAESKLLEYSFERPVVRMHEVYVTPDTSESPWKKPGPVAGPFKVDLGDGSVVTYHWYRFADQPALEKSGLTPDEREVLQKHVEKIHRHWTLRKTYIPEPRVKTPLAKLDPSLIVEPPSGFEIGYVPIVTKQEAKK